MYNPFLFVLSLFKHSASFVLFIQCATPIKTAVINTLHQSTIANNVDEKPGYPEKCTYIIRYYLHHFSICKFVGWGNKIAINLEKKYTNNSTQGAYIV